ncbi:MAG TPA: DUF2849 domain-containing protein [Afifellaceae bacterium]|nr:DUF2849 domain-containing protein [Afifellaceae bacterium]
MHIISANRLADGLVVFRCGDGRWSQIIAAAERIEDEAAIETALETALADVRANRVVDPYAVEVGVPENGKDPVAKRLRERIRISGPTTGHSLAKPRKRAA